MRDASCVGELYPGEELTRSLLDSLDHALLLVDAEGRVLFANALGNRLVATPAMAERLTAFCRETAAAAVGEISQERTLSIDGKLLAARAQRQQGTVRVTVRERTADNARELATIERERLGSVGALAAAVGFEISNPSAAVMHNLRALTDSVAILAGIASDPASVAPLPLVVDEFVGEAHVILAECAVGMERIHNLVRDLRSLMEADEGTAPQADVNAAVESSLGMVQAELRHRSRVERDLRATRLARCTPARLGHVLISLLSRSAQTLDHRHYRKNKVRVSTRDEPGAVSIEISDNGRGLPADAANTAFEHLFDPKARGSGPGLGLSVADGIVRAAGGTITVQSTPGNGTTVRVRLPTTQAIRASQQRVRIPSAAPPSPRRLRVLVVDDEVLLLKAYRRMMGKTMDVEMAEGAEQALARIEEGREFDVVLCDLSMPKMSGIEFHKLVQRRWPKLADRFVFATGGAMTMASKQFLDHTPLPWIEKPVAHERLVSIIELVSGH
ncbi:MAG: ATP-binding protein [Polyangiaceae bacterium]